MTVSLARTVKSEKCTDLERVRLAELEVISQMLVHAVEVVWKLRRVEQLLFQLHVLPNRKPWRRRRLVVAAPLR
jgi:hypothetical protein